MSKCSQSADSTVPTDRSRREPRGSRHECALIKRFYVAFAIGSAMTDNGRVGWQLHIWYTLTNVSRFNQRSDVIRQIA